MARGSVSVCSSALSNSSTAPKKNGPSTVKTSTPWNGRHLLGDVPASSSPRGRTSTAAVMRRKKFSSARMTPTSTAIDEVREDAEPERDQHDRDVGARRAPGDPHDRRDLAHVERDDEQDRGERRERDVVGERGEHHQDQQYRRRMGDAGDRAVAAMPDVGRGSRDGAGGREPAEQPRAHVRDPWPTSS